MTYPTTLDELTDGVPSDGLAPTTELDDATYPHDDHHRELAQTLEGVESVLGYGGTMPGDLLFPDLLGEGVGVVGYPFSGLRFGMDGMPGDVGVYGLVGSAGSGLEIFGVDDSATLRGVGGVFIDGPGTAKVGMNAIRTIVGGPTLELVSDDGEIDVGSAVIKSVDDPVDPQDAATKASQDAAVAAEAALARNADNLTSGTVADARIASTIARDSEVAAAYQPLDADLTDIAGIADAQGDLLVRGTSGWERLAKSATSTDVLTAGASQPAWTAPAGGGDPTPRRESPSSSAFYATPMSVVDYDQASQAASTAQVAFWWPCYAHRAMTVVEFATYCWALEVGSTLRCGIYANSGTDLSVGSLVVDAGTIAGTTTGAKTLALSQAVSAGFFWVCTWVSNHTTVRWNRGTTKSHWTPFGVAIANGRSYTGYTASAVDYSSGLPSSPPALTVMNTTDAPGVNGAFPYWRFT